MIKKIIKTDEEWGKILTPDQYRVMRHAGTEAPFSCAWDTLTIATIAVHTAARAKPRFIRHPFESRDSVAESTQAGPNSGVLGTPSLPKSREPAIRYTCRPRGGRYIENRQFEAEGVELASIPKSLSRS